MDSTMVRPSWFNELGHSWHLDSYWSYLRCYCVEWLFRRWCCLNNAIIKWFVLAIKLAILSISFASSIISSLFYLLTDIPKGGDHGFIWWLYYAWSIYVCLWKFRLSNAWNLLNLQPLLQQNWAYRTRSNCLWLQFLGVIKCVGTI